MEATWQYKKPIVFKDMEAALGFMSALYGHAGEKLTFVQGDFSMQDQARFMIIDYISEYIRPIIKIDIAC